MPLPQLAQFVATCSTPGCGNEGVPVTVTAAAEDPYVLCGGCETRITAVRPAEAPE